MQNFAKFVATLGHGLSVLRLQVPPNGATGRTHPRLQGQDPTAGQERKEKGTQKEEARKTRSIRARWLQQCGWTAAVAAIIHSCQYGHCSSGRDLHQDQWQQAGKGLWHGPSTSRPESTYEESWTGDFAGDRELSFPKGQQQRANDQVASQRMETAQKATTRLQADIAQQKAVWKRFQDQITQEYDAQRAKYQERMVSLQDALKKAEEDFSEAKKALQAAAKTTEEVEAGRAHDGYRLQRNTWQWSGNLSQKENAGGMTRDRRPTIEEVEAGGPGPMHLRRGHREGETFWVGRYPSRQADGGTKRPRFYNAVEKYFYDDKSAIGGDDVVRRLTYLNEGLQRETVHRLPPLESVAPHYHEEQAYYVALLMQHEVVAQDFSNEQLGQSSPFHEDYWDSHLEDMANKRSGKQRHGFQGCYLATRVDNNNPLEEDFNQAVTMKSTGMLTMDTVETTPVQYFFNDELYGNILEKPNRTISAAKSPEFWPIETVEITPVHQLSAGETHDYFLNEILYNDAAGESTRVLTTNTVEIEEIYVTAGAENDFANRRIAHATGTPNACTNAQEGCEEPTWQFFGSTGPLQRAAQLHHCQDRREQHGLLPCRDLRQEERCPCSLQQAYRPSSKTGRYQS